MVLRIADYYHLTNHYSKSRESARLAPICVQMTTIKQFCSNTQYAMSLRNLADLYTAWLAADYNVRTAYDGEQALDTYNKTVDVVLLDRRLPIHSGNEVLEELRERPGE